MLLLTTLERVKTLYGTNPGIVTDARDSQINQLIEQISRQLQRWINVDFETKERTETFWVDAGRRFYTLKSYPVSDTPAPVVDNEGGTPEFHVTDRGILLLDDAYTPIPGNHALTVTYTAGLGTTADHIVGTDFEDITLACEAQVLHILTRSPHLGATSLSLAGGSRSFEQPVKLLPQVTELIYPFRRA